MTDAQRVELNVPATTDSVMLARLTVAALAAQVGFDIEQIEDLRLAVDELCSSLIQPDGSVRLLLTFRYDDECLEVTGALDKRAPAPVDGETEELSLRILDALVDDHGRSDDGLSSAWLRKRRQASGVG